MIVGADVDATLLGGLGRDGKNASVPFGNTVVPFVVGSVGDPILGIKKRNGKI